MQSTPTDGDSARRARMVETQIVPRGVRDPRVLDAMREVPRHLFVAPDERAHAYEDHPLPIGGSQTISQPYIVALMTELLGLPARARVLEIGTGSGYQSAVLSKIAGEVYSIEILPDLARAASRKLKELGYDNVTVREGDGYRGWPEHAPYDGIIVTAAPEKIPEPLVDQLAVGRPHGDPRRRLLPGVEGLHPGDGRPRHREGHHPGALRSDDRRDREGNDAGSLDVIPSAARDPGLDRIRGHRARDPSAPCASG